MTTEHTTYESFFETLQASLDNGQKVNKDDRPKLLKIGFSVDGNTHLARVVELKYAKDAGIDISIYMNLK